MGCCGGGGGHLSKKHSDSHNAFAKTTVWTWLIGIAAIFGVLYFFN
ncbi:MAG: hypothetical protein ABF649_16655 [Bacillus sp. (in: firmicutes)]